MVVSVDGMVYYAEPTRDIYYISLTLVACIPLMLMLVRTAFVLCIEDAMTVAFHCCGCHGVCVDAISMSTIVVSLETWLMKNKN